MDLPRMLSSLRKQRGLQALGPGGLAVGIALVAFGLILEESSFGIGWAIRTLGGILFLGGLAVVVLGNSHHRAVAFGIAKRMVARYRSRTANWGWPDRIGLAAVVVGVALVVPALVLQILFRSGAAIAIPASILFWGGIMLLIYGRCYKRNAGENRPGSSSLSHNERRGRGRRWR